MRVHFIAGPASLISPPSIGQCLSIHTGGPLCCRGDGQIQKKSRLKLSYSARSATVIEKLIIKERSICFIIIQMDQIAEIHLEAAILTKRHLTSADAPEQADVPPEVVIVVVTADRPVPKGPWAPEAAPDRRVPSDPEVIPALRAQWAQSAPEDHRVFRESPALRDPPGQPVPTA